MQVTLCRSSLHKCRTIVAEGDEGRGLPARLFLRKRSNDRIIQVDMAVFYSLPQRAGRRRSARSSIPTILCSRCWSARSDR